MKLKQHKHLLLFVSITVIFISTYMTSQANTLPVSLAYAQKELAKLEISSGGKLGVLNIALKNVFHSKVLLKLLEFQLF